MTLISKLVELWDFEALGAEPSGDSVAGLKSGLSLQLRRTSRTDGDGGTIGEGWVTTPGGKRAFNGQGLVELAERLALDADGDEITLVVRWWSMSPTADFVSQISEIFGAVGRIETGPNVEHGVFVEVNHSQLNGSAQTVSPVLKSASINSFDEALASETELSATVATWVMVISHVDDFEEFEEGEAAVTVRVNDVLCEPAAVPVYNGPDVGLLRGIDTDRFTCGDLEASNGAVLTFAIFAGALSPEELEDVGGPGGDGLDDLIEDLTGEMAGPGTANPLLNPDGTLGINIEWPLTRTPADAGVIASADSQGAAGRHTRLTHERAGQVRRYELEYNAADAGDVERIRQAVVITAGGAGTTRFRHPVDDPAGPVSTAPRVRIVEVGQWDRNRGGNVGKGRLVLEYV